MGLLTKNQGSLFVYRHHPLIPKTNNSLEGVNSQLKRKLGDHRGRKLVYFDYLVRLNLGGVGSIHSRGGGEGLKGEGEGGQSDSLGFQGVCDLDLVYFSHKIGNFGIPAEMRGGAINIGNGGHRFGAFIEITLF